MSGYDLDHPEELKIQGQKTALVRSFLISLLVVWMLFVTAFLVWNGLQGAAVRSTLVDCTQTGGKCFKANQSRSAAIIKQLLDDNKNTQRIVLLVSICQGQLNTTSVPELTSCVNERLKNDA